MTAQHSGFARAVRAAPITLALIALPVLADSDPQALDWLKKIYQATQTLSYSGTFVYQLGERTETSRIARIVGPQGGVERLQVLDGSPREIVRSVDGVRCYLPGLRVLKIDRQQKLRSFPDLLPEQTGQIAKHYRVTLGEIARIAGRECQVVDLVQRDAYRYGYTLCADRRSGMLLQAVTTNQRREPIERFVFTQFSLGPVDPESLKPAYATSDWRVEEVSIQPTELARSGWHIDASLPGFRRVIEVRRLLRDAQPVDQAVYSDGMAAVSVFIEGSKGRASPARPGLAQVGGVHVYTRRIGEHVVTVVGETPAASVRLIGDSVRYRP